MFISQYITISQIQLKQLWRTKGNKIGILIFFLFVIIYPAFFVWQLEPLLLQISNKYEENFELNSYQNHNLYYLFQYDQSQISESKLKPFLNQNRNFQLIDDQQIKNTSLLKQSVQDSYEIGFLFEKYERSMKNVKLFVNPFLNDLSEAVLLFFDDISQKIQFYAMPLSSMDLKSSLGSFSFLYVMMFSLGYLNTALYYKDFTLNRLIGRKDQLVYCGMNVWIYHLVYFINSGIILFIPLFSAMLVLNILGTKLVEGKVFVIWFFPLLLGQFQATILQDLVQNLVKSREKYETVMNTFTLLVNYGSILIFGFFLNSIPTYVFVILGFLPFASICLVFQSLMYVAYIEPLSIQSVYFQDFHLFAMIIVQIVTIAIYYILSVKMDATYYRQKRKDNKGSQLLLNESLVELPPQKPTLESSIFNFNVELEYQKTREQLENNQFMSKILFHRIKKVYQDKEKQTIYANNDISIQVNKGEVFGVLGPNGSGKTTLCKALIMAHTLDEGDIYIDGVNINQYKDMQGKINMCMQDDVGLFDDFTVSEHLQIYRSFGKKRSTIDIISIMGLQDHLTKRASELSGGWKRRLTIASTFMSDPEILVLDEITSGVDVEARSELWEVIKKLAVNKTVVATTHTLFEAEQFFDRTAFLVGGKLVCIGRNDELISQFGNRVYLEARNVIQKTSAQYADLVAILAQRGISAKRTTDAAARVQQFELIDQNLLQLFQTMIELQKQRIILEFNISQQTFDQIFFELLRMAQQ